MSFAAELARHGPGSPWRGTSVEAFDYCQRLARTHYENFAVASRFVPRPLRRHVAAVYAWCRWADDLADETGPEADALLAWWGEELGRSYAGTPSHPVTAALAETVTRFEIPPAPFRRLLDAFAQDQRVRDYGTFTELVAYCERSANPVGELVLYLYGCHRPEFVPLSDATCTGLQLANFWQDVARDRAIGRTYLPREDRERFGVGEGDLAATHCTPAMRELIRFEVDRARVYFARGAALPSLLPRAARRPVRLFGAGGVATLDAIRAAGYDVLTRRPRVSRGAKLRLALKALVGV